MALELINPDELPTHESCAQVVVATGGRTVFVAGQVARITIWVVGRPRAHPSSIAAARVAVFGDHKPADTLLGVAEIAEPGCLIETEAIAVVG
jgi:enamine deaminase RidA (YjgF/YER057c/UK114 family)